MKPEFKCSKPISSICIAVSAAFLAISLTVFFISCKDEGCEYSTPSPEGCKWTNTLNLSTGIDANGAVIPPGAGVVDPYWKLLNNPPLMACSDPLTSTINGSAYMVNYASIPSTGWANQPGSSTLAPVDLGTTLTFGCDNNINSAGNPVPYIFERSFCVLNKTTVDFNFTFKGDNQVRFELIDNVTGTVLSNSSTYVFVNMVITPTLSWTATALPLPVGSYSIRGYLVNFPSIPPLSPNVLGFSFVGNLTTTDGDLAISNNAEGCCENNTISVLNVLDENCNSIFDGFDVVGNNWTFNLRDASSAIIRTATTDINGNIFFSGLPDGTYTVEIVPQGGWVPTTPTITVSVANNTVEIVEFFNCK